MTDDDSYESQKRRIRIPAPKLPPIPKPPPIPTPTEVIDKITPKGKAAKPMAWITGIADDLLDFTPIGELPVIGDMADSIAMFWTARAYPGKGAAGGELVEFVPMADILPSFTASLASAEIAERRKKEMQRKWR